MNQPKTNVKTQFQPQSDPQLFLNPTVQLEHSRPYSAKAKTIKSDSNHTEAVQYSASRLDVNPNMPSANQVQTQSRVDYNISFSSIQKSLQILRMAIPQIFSDAMIDDIYLNLFRRFSHQSNCYDSQFDINSNSHCEVKYEQTNHQAYQFDQFQTFNDHFTFQDQHFDDIHSHNQKHLDKKIKNRNPQLKQKEIKKSMKEIWNDSLENELLMLYKQRKPFNQIRYYFTQKYPSRAEYFTYYQIRGECNKIMRMALKKLNYYIQHFKQSLPELKRIKQSDANYIFYFKAGYEIRLLLVELYQQEAFDMEFVGHLIKAINRYLAQMAISKP